MRQNLITIAGMSRGGTNLLWNIIQSHPAVVDTYYELNELYGRKTDISLTEKALVEFEALTGVAIPAAARITRERLQKFARYSLENDPYNRYKTRTERYDPTEYEGLTLCTKLVSAWESDVARKLLRRNDALKYLPILDRLYDNKVLFLIRNGLAMAEGWGRRGASVSIAAEWYAKYVAFYEAYAEAHPEKAMILRFEDLMAQPFAVAQKAFSFLKLDPVALDELRIAIKPTIRSNQDVQNTTEKTKLWLNRTNWSEHMDADINAAQIARLTEEQRDAFVARTGLILQRHGYN